MSSYYDKKNKKNMKFRISFVLMFIFASFLACFALYMRDGEVPEHEYETVTENTEAVTEAEIQSDMPQNERASTVNINPIAESAKLDREYLDSCMFAGDSLIVGLGTYGIIPESQIAANIGMNVMSINNKPLVDADGSEIMAADKINQAAPDNLYILLGLNLLDSYTNDQLLASYGDFVDSIDRNHTNIYIISVPPVTGERETNDKKPILNSDIDSFNSELLKFANNRSLYYLDLNTALKGADGRLDTEYAEADGIHFQKATYEIFIDYILTHVYQK